MTEDSLRCSLTLRDELSGWTGPQRRADGQSGQARRQHEQHRDSIGVGKAVFRLGSKHSGKQKNVYAAALAAASAEGTSGRFRTTFESLDGFGPS